MSLNEFIEKINQWSASRTPFLFLIDFEMQKPVAFRLSDVSHNDILFDINGVTNAKHSGHAGLIELQAAPIAFKAYEKKYRTVERAIHRGDSYLTNLTIKTPVTVNLSLEEIFRSSRARYKILYKDSFTVFSPEIFVRVIDDKIFSFPMKGTIDEAFPDARNVILNDKKELAEHVTIVDLIRNDLSIVADQVTVTDFRYIEKIKTTAKTLLQVSSKIEGIIKRDFANQLGSLIVALLPAGSVSGAPKRKTVGIIETAENEPRGYYTGVCGIFDGKNLDSGVMIRYIEKVGDDFYYRSGGGITALSSCEKEYQETIDKIYVPLA
ncbi:MAG TPA: aminodeoxychorismate synthase component I [Chryseosolibacter sp.]|nr:aminodeoxychorismate synthase component I [Chryseosolibacter sp.]